MSNGKEPSDTTQWSSDNPFAPSDTTAAGPQWSDDNPFAPQGTAPPEETVGQEATRRAGQVLKHVVTGFIPGIIEMGKLAGTGAYEGARFAFNKNPTPEDIQRTAEKGKEIYETAIRPIGSAAAFAPEAMYRELTGKGFTREEAMQRMEEFFGVAGTFALGETVGGVLRKVGGKKPPAKPGEAPPPEAPPPAGPVVSPEEQAAAPGSFAEAKTPEERAAVAAQMAQQAKEVEAAATEARRRRQKAKTTWETLSPEQRKQIAPGLADVDYEKSWEDLSADGRSHLRKKLNLVEPPPTAPVTNLVPSEPAPAPGPAPSAVETPVAPASQAGVALKGMDVPALKTEFDKAADQVKNLEAEHSALLIKGDPESPQLQEARDYLDQVENELDHRSNPPTVESEALDKIQGELHDLLNKYRELTSGLKLRDRIAPDLQVKLDAIDKQYAELQKKYHSMLHGPELPPSKGGLPVPGGVITNPSPGAVGSGPFHLGGAAGGAFHYGDPGIIRIMTETPEAGLARDAAAKEPPTEPPPSEPPKAERVELPPHEGTDVGGMDVPTLKDEIAKAQGKLDNLEMLNAMGTEVTRRGNAPVVQKWTEYLADLTEELNKRIPPGPPPAEPEAKLPTDLVAVRAAIRGSDGKIYTGVNHGDAYDSMPDGVGVEEQGWVNKAGEFFQPTGKPVQKTLDYQKADHLATGGTEENFKPLPDTPPSEPTRLHEPVEPLELDPALREQLNKLYERDKNAGDLAQDLYGLMTGGRSWLEMSPEARANLRKLMETFIDEKEAAAKEPPTKIPLNKLKELDAKAAEIEARGTEKMRERNRIFKEHDERTQDDPDAVPSYDSPEALANWAEYEKINEEFKKLPEAYKQLQMRRATQAIEIAKQKYMELRKRYAKGSPQILEAENKLNDAYSKLRNTAYRYGKEVPTDTSPLYLSTAKLYKDAGVSVEPPSRPEFAFTRDPKVIAKLKELEDHFERTRDERNERRGTEEDDQDYFQRAMAENDIRDRIMQELSDMIPEGELRRYFEPPPEYRTSESADARFAWALRMKETPLEKQQYALGEVRRYLNDIVEGKADEEGNMYSIDPDALQGSAVTETAGAPGNEPHFYNAKDLGSILDRLEELNQNPELAAELLKEVDSKLEEIGKDLQARDDLERQSAVDALTSTKPPPDEPPPPDAGSPAKLTPQGPQGPVAGTGEAPPTEKPESGRRRHGFRERASEPRPKPMGEQTLEELQAALLEYESREDVSSPATQDTIDALKELINERLQGIPPDLPPAVREAAERAGMTDEEIGKFSAFDNDQLLAHFEQTKNRLRSAADPADMNDLAAMYDLTLKEIKRRKLSIPIHGDESLERNRQAAANRQAAEEVIGQPPTIGATAVAKAIYNGSAGLERGTTWNDLSPMEQQSYIRLVRTKLATADLGKIKVMREQLAEALENNLITPKEHEAGLAELVERQSSLVAADKTKPRPNKTEIDQIIQEVDKATPPKPGQPPAVLGFKLPDTVTYNPTTGELVPKDLNKFSMDQLKNTIRSIGAMLQSPDVQKMTKVAEGLKKEMDRIWDYRKKLDEELGKGQAGPGLALHKIDVPGLPVPPEDAYFSKKIVTGAWLKRPFNIVKFFREAYQGTVKYSHALNVDDRLYEGATGEKLPVHKQAGKLAEMFDGWLTKAEAFAKGDGPFVPDDKGFTQLTGAKSLADIIVNTAKSDVERLGWLWAARRALDLMATQGKDIGVDLGYATDMVIKSPQHLHKAVDEGRAYHSGLSAYAVWGGLIDAVRRGQMEAETAYGPIRRMYGPDAVIQKIAKLIQATGKSAKTIRASEEFKKLKGSNLLIRNMAEQSLDVTHRIIRAADQNKLYQTLVQHAIDAPEAFRGLIEPFNHRERLAITKEMNARTEAVKALFAEEGIDISTRHADIFANMLGDDALNVEGGKLIVMREGKIEPWRVDELTAKSLKAMSPEQLGLFVKMMGNGFEVRGHQIPGLARVARAGIIGDIKFLADVFIGDQFQSFINSNYNMIPVIHPFKAWWNIVHNTESFKEAVRAGGIEKSALRGRTTFDDLLAGPNPSPIELAGRQFKEMHPVKAFWTIVTPMREAARFAEYQLARGAGESPVAAAWAARDLTGNYSLHGTFTTVRALNQMSLFFGPAVAVLDKTARTIKDHPARWFARGATIAAVSYLLYLANEDDEEMQEIRQTPAGQRWWMVRMPPWVPGVGGQIVKIMRKPYFEGAIFGDGIEAAMDAYKGTNPDAFKLWATSIKQELTLDMLPVFGAVPAQIYFNQDIHSGSQIIPESQKNLDPEYQTGYYSGSAERMVGKALGISPAILNYAARGFTGYLGESAWRLASGALDWQATRELPPAEEWPLMQRVMAPYPSYGVKPVKDFYELADRVDNAAQTIAYVLHHDPENFEVAIRRHEADGQLAGMVNRTRQEISDMRRHMQMIDDIKDMGPQTKKLYRDQYMKIIIEKARAAAEVGRAVEDSYK